MPTNAFDQPIGPSLGDWRPPQSPLPIELLGRTVRLEPLDLSVHASPLFDAFVDAPDSLWTYLQHGPFAGVEELRAAATTAWEYRIARGTTPCPAAGSGPDTADPEGMPDSPSSVPQCNADNNGNGNGLPSSSNSGADATPKPGSDGAAAPLPARFTG